MSFYMIFCCVMIFAAFFKSTKQGSIMVIRWKEENIDLVWICMVLACFIVLGFRNVDTGDNLAYTRGLEMIRNNSYVYYSHNYLYIAICKLALYLNGNIHLVYMICAALSLYFFNKGVCALNCNKYFYLVLYLLTFQFFDQFNIIRQGVAMSIAFYAVVYYLLNEKNFKKYLICIVLASLFHLSAIVMIPVFFIVQRKIPFSIIIGSIIGMYFLSSLTVTIFSKIFSVFWVNDYSKQFEFALITLSEVVIAILILSMRRRIAFDEKDNIVLNLTWLFPFFRMGAAQFFILHRISKFFIFYYILSLLMLNRLAKDKSKWIINFAILAFYLLWFGVYIHDYTSFFPYKMISFSEMFR